MDILAYLIPISLILGGTGLAGFFWAMRSHQFDDPDGDAARILCADWDDTPNPGEVPPRGS
ncbi:MAG: cbb3-type cytochrome oxidase assembly protein CcoS [Pseudomonadota bacterium]